MIRIPRAAGVLVLLLAACDAYPTDQNGGLPPAAAIPLHIPSEGETMFAETRDFTVVGYFDEPLARPGDVRVELFAGPSTDRTPVRIVRSHVDPATGTTPRDALDLGYAAGQAWGPDGPVTDPSLVVVSPDVVAVPGGLEDPTNKAVVTNEYYAAAVLGGVSKEFDTDYAAAGVSWTDLTAGTYTIRVTGLSGQLEGLTATRQIEFGRTHAMLGRFSPEVHRQALLAHAAAAGYRTYTDFFPGFFSHEGYSFEIPGRWMANNSVEVVNTSPTRLVDDIAGSLNDVLLYNISLTSATNRIEIGAIVAHELLDDRTTFHHYDIGEPTLTYVDAASGEQQTLDGAIRPLPPGDRLVLTRVEVRPADDIAGDNLYDIGDGTPLVLDPDPEDGVAVGGGDEFSVFGVVTPIPTTVQPGPLAHQYEMDDAIAAVRYEIRDAGGSLVRTSTGEVGLGRRYDPVQEPDRVSPSVYEFEHELRIEAGPGAYAVTLTGLDTGGQPVPGTTEAFTVTVTDVANLAAGDTPAH